MLAQNILKELQNIGVLTNSYLSNKLDIDMYLIEQMLIKLVDCGYLINEDLCNTDDVKFKCKFCPYAGNCGSSNYKTLALSKKGKNYLITGG